MRNVRRWLICVSLVFALNAVMAEGMKGDAEAAKHGDEAASLQIVKKTEITQPDLIFRQYDLSVLSHYSYLVGSKGEAIVVDPARDIARYVKDAAQLGLKITRIYLTHSHADFIAGHVELAKATGAPIIINKATGALYPHLYVNDGDVLQFGNIRLQVLTTPGHTPDGTCMTLYHPADAKDPRLVFTGDTLFIGSVGRPDLLGDNMSAAELARMGFESWAAKLSKLPDGTLIFPAHGAGSLCGAHLSDEPVSTIGEQRKQNAYLQHKDLTSYVMAVLDGLPEAPQYFQHNAKINHDGPQLIDQAPRMPPVLDSAAIQKLAAEGAWLIDARDAKDFSAGHIPGAINIGIRGRFETWTGMMIPWGAPFVLIGSEENVAEARQRLHRIGYDSPAGFLKGGMDAWQKASLPRNTLRLVQPNELAEQIKKGTAPVLVDVRLPSEWMGLRIAQQLLNIPVNKLFAEKKRLDPGMPVLTICNSAYRSSMGASVLLKAGFKDVRNLQGGGEAWIEAGLPSFGAGSHGPAPAQAGTLVNMPESMGSQDLAARLMDLPGSVEVVDVRPSWQFAEYSIPGSVNVPVNQLISGPAYLTDARPLVVVCRDGQISAAASGMLYGKSQRSIRYLAGGITRYFEDIAKPTGIQTKAVPATPATTRQADPVAAPPPSAPAAVPAPSPAAAPAPAAPKKKSAGC